MSAYPLSVNRHSSQRIAYNLRLPSGRDAADLPIHCGLLRSRPWHTQYDTNARLCCMDTDLAVVGYCWRLLRVSQGDQSRNSAGLGLDKALSRQRETARPPHEASPAVTPSIAGRHTARCAVVHTHVQLAAGQLPGARGIMPLAHALGGAGREGGRGVSQQTAPPCRFPLASSTGASSLPAARRRSGVGGFRSFELRTPRAYRVGIALRCAHDPRTPALLCSSCIPYKWAKGNGQDRSICHKSHEVRLTATSCTD
jgi:hypothetical protein